MSDVDESVPGTNDADPLDLSGLTRDESPAGNEGPTDAVMVRRAAARVLVIDDEAPVANFLSEALAAMGVNATVACDGLAALDAFHAATPDLILCDLLIPKRNGFQLLEDFRREAPRVPVVAMSGIYKPEKYAEELSHLAMFIRKPVDLAQVEQCVALLDRTLAERAETVTGESESQAAAPARQREPWIPLSVLPLPKLLHLLWRDGRTGLVTVQAEERQIVLLIQDGRLRFVRSNEQELRLDRVLLQLGRCSPEALEAAREALGKRTTPTRLGEVLVEQGVLSRSDLDKAIVVQLRRIIATAFAQTRGETLFREDTLPETEELLMDSDLRAVIVAGCQSLRDGGDRLLGHLPDGACRVERGPAASDPEVKLPPTLARLMEAVDEPIRLSDVASMADLVGLRGRAVVFGLLCAEVLSISAEQESWTAGLLHATQPRDVDLSPMEAMLELEAQRASGVLRASWQGASAWLAFDDGRIVQGGSSDARTRIGGLLRTAGLVTPEQLEKALREQSSRPGRPLGNVLMEMGLLTPAALRHAVSAQVLWVARDMLARPEWETASFAENEAPEKEPVDVEDGMTDIVLDTLRQMDEKALVDLVRVLAAGRPALDLDALYAGRFQLTEGEELVASALAPATQQVLDALSDSERLDLEVLRVLAMALLVTKRDERPVVAAMDEEPVIEVEVD
jgi:DNA-binding response OmpR family regulator